MNETPFLILHKVRGLPTFDIALRFDEVPDRYDHEGRVKHYIDAFDQIEDDLPPWWVVPASGLRAYPFQWWALEDLVDASDINHAGFHDRPIHFEDKLPVDWPEHRPIPTPRLALASIAALLGIVPVKIERRF